MVTPLLFLCLAGVTSSLLNSPNFISNLSIFSSFSHKFSQFNNRGVSEKKSGVLRSVAYWLRSMEEEEEGDIEFLPLDVISCILLWLPVSSLLRFKSVCKSWLSLIEAPDFVDKHALVSFLTEDGKQKLNLIILTRKLVSRQQVSLFSILDCQEVPLDFPVIGSHYDVNPVEIVASCKGIICLRQHRRICLWNPATKQCTNLPPLPVVMSDVGFGFDPKANDYKAVAINWSDYRHVFYLYSSSANSWKKFEGLALPNVRICSSMNILYRDTIYCWDASTNCDRIVYMFDFSDEVFTSIPYPGSMYFYMLFTITENIACAVKLERDELDFEWPIEPNTKYEIWMLSDYQVKESWTKLYSIDLDPTRTGEFIEWMTWVSDENKDCLLYQIGKQLGMYDLVAQQVTILPFQASDSFHAVEYRESILSIKLGNGAADALKSMDCSQRMLIAQSMTENNDWSDSDVHKAVINRILSWLPAFSLQCFKSVCKSWHSLIQSSDFVAQHLYFHHHHHQHKQDNLSFILHSMHEFEESSLHSPNTSVTCLLSEGKLELLDFPFGEYPSIQFSFDGIVCLGSNHYGHCCLWNPVTKQFRDLCPDSIPHYEDTFHLGFGFDAKTNGYKVVRFFRGYGSVVQIYWLSTGSWRTISDEILPTITSISSGLDAPYRDGIYCWLVDIDSSFEILSFDFSNEVFRTISLPDSINWSSLAVLRDRIVCISLEESYNYYSDDTNSWNCEIWMMNEYGVSESWGKLCKVGPFSKDWRFKTCYSKKSGDYMLLMKEGQLYEYNLVTQERERIPCQIQGPEDYQLVAYEPSLISIK